MSSEDVARRRVIDWGHRLQVPAMLLLIAVGVAGPRMASELKPSVEASPPLAVPRPGDQSVATRDHRPMIWISPGEFLFGSPESEPGRVPAAEVLHRYRIERGYWLDATEVTNGAYQAFIRVEPEWQTRSPGHDAYYLHDWKGSDYPAGKRDHPVVYVSWSAARAYCQWAGKRLPTEPEWEYAARAATTTAYWWGDAFDAGRANNRMHTEAVGSPQRRNPWGLYDMLGNVWEWTESKDAAFPYRAADGREDPAASGERSIRGGSWFFAPTYLRTAFRGWSDPKIASDVIGFRCAA